MLSISKKWLGTAFLIGLVLMVIFQVYLYKSEFTTTHLINILFLSGLTEVCVGGLVAIFQTGVFDIVVNSIRYFWRAVSQFGRWIKDNEMNDSELVLYDHDKRKKRHPLPLSCAWIGLVLCLISFVFSFI